MARIKDVAPTITHALKAVELGCRKIQEDACFLPMMSTFMAIEDDYCFGCLATCTLMQLTGKTGTQLIARFSPVSVDSHKNPAERKNAFNVESDLPDYRYFEYAIDCLRENDLFPLLNYYNLHQHEKATEAIFWLREHRKETLIDSTTKDDLRRYADFLQDVLIPKIETWFAA